MRGRIAVETGLRVVADASVSGPIIEGKLQAKIAAYYSYDNGWFTNLFDNSEFGKDRQFIVRPMLRFPPSDNVKVLLRFEHGQAKRHAPATPHHAHHSPHPPENWTNH